MSGLSIPIPNAVVATTVWTRPSMNASWVAERSAGSSPAW
jgi:hypothetical protein